MRNKNLKRLSVTPYVTNDVSNGAIRWDSRLSFVPAGASWRLARERMIEHKAASSAAREMQAHCWNRKTAAQVLCISDRALLYKIKETGLPLKR